MGRNVNLSLVCHDEIWLLLPWYANQSLLDQERELVEEHLKVCVACRGGLTVQQNLLENMRDSTMIELCEYVQFANLVEKIRYTADAEERLRRPVRDIVQVKTGSV